MKYEPPRPQPQNRAQRRAAQKAYGGMPKRGDRHAFRMVRQMRRAQKEAA